MMVYRNTRTRIWLALSALAAALPVLAQNAPTDSIKSHLTLKTFTDFGHIVSGTNTNANAGVDPDISMQPLNRANFLAIQEVATRNFDIQAGLSGLIWWPYGGGITDASERAMNVKPMIPVARLRWRFGQPSATSGALQIGTFNYKYNPDAKDLGEYLYRSGTYPGFLFTTEGWLLMNRASNYSHGALLSVSQFGGALKNNFSMFMETNYFTVGDFSPGYDISYTHKWFELGGGLVLNHYLALRPSFVKPKELANTYVHASVDTAPGKTINFYGPESEIPSSYYGPGDTIPTNFDASNPSFKKEILHRWTSKGVKAMGRAVLNLNSLLPVSISNPEDLRIFGEVAVLGWENQPLYYEKLVERVPIMFGINVPTMKLLDVLTLQGEYYASPFSDISKLNSASLPIWGDGLSTIYNSATFTDVIVLDNNGKVVPKTNHKDDWKWSFYAKKTVNKTVAVYAQAASDHLRLTDGKFNASSVPLTGSPSEWYYVLRLEFTLR